MPLLIVCMGLLLVGLLFGMRAAKLNDDFDEIMREYYLDQLNHGDNIFY